MHPGIGDERETGAGHEDVGGRNALRHDASTTQRLPDRLASLGQDVDGQVASSFRVVDEERDASAEAGNWVRQRRSVTLCAPHMNARCRTSERSQFGSCVLRQAAPRMHIALWNQTCGRQTTLELLRTTKTARNVQPRAAPRVERIICCSGLLRKAL